MRADPQRTRPFSGPLLLSVQLGALAPPATAAAGAIRAALARRLQGHALLIPPEVLEDGGVPVVRAMLAAAERPGVVSPLVSLASHSARRFNQAAQAEAQVRELPLLLAVLVWPQLPQYNDAPSIFARHDCAWEEAVAEEGAHPGALLVADTVAAVANSALHLPLSGEGQLADLALSTYRLVCRRDLEGALASITTPFQAWQWVQRHAAPLSEAELPALEHHRSVWTVLSFRNLLRQAASVTLSEMADLPVVTAGAELVHADLASVDMLLLLVPRAQLSRLGAIPGSSEVADAVSGRLAEVAFGPLEVSPDFLGPRRMANRTGALLYGVASLGERELGSDLVARMPVVERAAWVVCPVPEHGQFMHASGRWTERFINRLTNTVWNRLRPARLEAPTLDEADEEDADGPFVAPAGATAVLVPPAGAARIDVLALLRVSTRQQVKKSATLFAQTAVVGAGLRFLDATAGTVHVRLFTETDRGSRPIRDRVLLMQQLEGMPAGAVLMAAHVTRLTRNLAGLHALLAETDRRGIALATFNCGAEKPAQDVYLLGDGGGRWSIRPVGEARVLQPGEAVQAAASYLEGHGRAIAEQHSVYSHNFLMLERLLRPGLEPPHFLRVVLGPLGDREMHTVARASAEEQGSAPGGHGATAANGSTFRQQLLAPWLLGRPMSGASVLNGVRISQGNDGVLAAAAACPPGSLIFFTSVDRASRRPGDLGRLLEAATQRGQIIIFLLQQREAVAAALGPEPPYLRRTLAPLLTPELAAEADLDAWDEQLKRQVRLMLGTSSSNSFPLLLPWVLDAGTLPALEAAEAAAGDFASGGYGYYTTTALENLAGPHHLPDRADNAAMDLVRPWLTSSTAQWVHAMDRTLVGLSGALSRRRRAVGPVPDGSQRRGCRSCRAGGSRRQQPRGMGLCDLRLWEQRPGPRLPVQLQQVRKGMRAALPWQLPRHRGVPLPHLVQLPLRGVPWKHVGCSSGAGPSTQLPALPSAGREQEVRVLQHVR